MTALSLNSLARSIARKISRAEFGLEDDRHFAAKHRLERLEPRVHHGTLHAARVLGVERLPLAIAARVEHLLTEGGEDAHERARIAAAAAAAAPAAGTELHRHRRRRFEHGVGQVLVREIHERCTPGEEAGRRRRERGRDAGGARTFERGRVHLDQINGEDFRRDAVRMVEVGRLLRLTGAGRRCGRRGDAEASERVDQSGIYGKPRAVDDARLGRGGGVGADRGDQSLADDDRAALDGWPVASHDARVGDGVRLGHAACGRLREQRRRGRRWCGDQGRHHADAKRLIHKGKLRSGWPNSDSKEKVSLWATGREVASAGHGRDLFHPLRDLAFVEVVH